MPNNVIAISVTTVNIKTNRNENKKTNKCIGISNRDNE